MQIPLAVIRGDDRHGFGVGHRGQVGGSCETGFATQVPDFSKRTLEPGAQHHARTRQSLAEGTVECCSTVFNVFNRNLTDTYTYRIVHFP